MSITTTTAFRNAMATVAAPVLILTTPNLRGATLSSVTSLSINPHPLLQFNLMKPSTTSTNLHTQGQFALHILKPTPESGELARKFARNGYFDEISRQYVTVSPFEGLEEGLDYETVNGLPLLKQVERVLVCEKETVMEVQDHEIWVARVTQVKEILGGKTGGLLNFNRGFGKVDAHN